MKRQRVSRSQKSEARGQGAGRPWAARRRLGEGGSVVRGLWSMVCGPWSVVCLLVSVLFLPLISSAIEPVDISETWAQPGTAGWAREGGPFGLSNPDQYLSMRFEVQGQPVPSADTTYTNIIAGIMVTNVSLRFRAQDVLPSEDCS